MYLGRLGPEGGPSRQLLDSPKSRHTGLTQLESECSEDYHSPLSGHGAE